MKCSLSNKPSRLFHHVFDDDNGSWLCHFINITSAVKHLDALGVCPRRWWNYPLNWSACMYSGPVMCPVAKSQCYLICEHMCAAKQKHLGFGQLFSVRTDNGPCREQQVDTTDSLWPFSIDCDTILYNSFSINPSWIKSLQHFKECSHVKHRFQHISILYKLPSAANIASCFFFFLFKHFYVVCLSLIDAKFITVALLRTLLVFRALRKSSSLGVYLKNFTYCLILLYIYNINDIFYTYRQIHLVE